MEAHVQLEGLGPCPQRPKVVIYLCTHLFVLSNVTVYKHLQDVLKPIS